MARDNGRIRLASDTESCQGPLLSRTQYLADIEKLGFKNARLTPEGTLTDLEGGFTSRRSPDAVNTKS